MAPSSSFSQIRLSIVSAWTPSRAPYGKNRVKGIVRHGPGVRHRERAGDLGLDVGEKPMGYLAYGTCAAERGGNGLRCINYIIGLSRIDALMQG
jgi:hypothetical protein